MLKAAEAREAGTLGAGGVLRLVRDGTATTRNELAENSELAKGGDELAEMAQARKDAV